MEAAEGLLEAVWGGWAALGMHKGGNTPPKVSKRIQGGGVVGVAEVLLEAVFGWLGCPGNAISG